MKRLVEATLVIAVGVVLAASTAYRVHLWADGERLLWFDAIQKAPEKPRPWVNLGNQYLNAGFKELAEDAYERASMLAENPHRLRDERAYGFSLAQANLALLQAQSGDLRGAVNRLRAVTKRYHVTSVVELQKWFERQLASTS